MTNPNESGKERDFNIPSSSKKLMMPASYLHDHHDSIFFGLLLAHQVRKTLLRPEVKELMDETPTLSLLNHIVTLGFMDGDSITIEKTFGMTSEILSVIESGKAQPFDPKVGYVFGQYGATAWYGPRDTSTQPAEEYMTSLFFGLRRSFDNRQKMKEAPILVIVPSEVLGPQVDPRLN